MMGGEKHDPTSTGIIGRYYINAYDIWTKVEDAHMRIYPLGKRVKCVLDIKTDQRQITF